MTVLARAATLLAAVAAAGWLGLGLRSSELQADAFRLAARPQGAVSPAELAAARARLDDARLAVPDGQPVSVEAGLLVRHGARADAVAALERLVRLEPRNPLMWLALSGGPVSEERRAQARSALARLAPPPAR